jgi:alpha-tubulin suppressor-like RCC1 family protein
MVWGGGELYNFGLLGNGTTHASDSPLAVSGVGTATHVASGFGQILVLNANGTVTAWGSNAVGELGVGEGPESCGYPCSTHPVAVPGLSGVTAIAAGGYHSLAALSNGTVMAWGLDDHGQLGSEPAPETCVLGETTSFPCSRKPIAVPALTGVIAVAGGYHHSLALLSNGKVMAWGENTTGELGNGTTTDSAVPVEVTGLSNVVAISAGYAESMAVLANGTVMAWGGNGHGQLGQEEHPATGPELCGPESEPCSKTPVQVKGLSGVKAVSDGYWNAVAVLENGSVRTWGNNATGELGIGNSSGPETCPFPNQPCSSTPVEVAGLSGISEVAASKDTQVLALREDGRVMAWGIGSGGNLGNGVHTGKELCKRVFYCSTVPVQVMGIVDATGIAAGAESGVAMLPVASPPEYGRCLKVSSGEEHYEGGKYEAAGCTKEGAERKFEWYPGVAKTGFTVAAGETTLETNKFGVTFRCKSVTGSGEYSGRKSVANVVLRFHECEEGLPTGWCTSPGAAAGEIVTSPLSGALGIEKKSTEGPSKDKIGWSLSAGENAFAEFNCPATAPDVVRGTVLGPLSANVMTQTPNRSFKSAKGKQKPEQFEGGVVEVLKESLEHEPFEQTGLVSTMTLTNEEKVEVNSVN